MCTQTADTGGGGTSLAIALATNDIDEYVWILVRLAAGDLRVCRGAAGRGNRSAPFGLHRDADINWVTNREDDLQFKLTAGDRQDRVQ